MANRGSLANLTSTTGIAVSEASAVACVWGTDQFAVSSMAGFIVKSFRVSPRNEEILIEQGSGFDAIQIMLLDGNDFEVNLVDDVSKTLPPTNAKLTFLNPFTGSTVATAICVRPSYAAERKTEGTVTILAKNFVLITSPSGTAYP